MNRFSIRNSKTLIWLTFVSLDPGQVGSNNLPSPFDHLNHQGFSIFYRIVNGIR